MEHRRAQALCAATAALAALLLIGLASPGAPAAARGLVVAAQPAGTFAPSFAVAGLVAAPRSFSLDDLVALPQVDLPVTFGAGQSIQSAVFTGPTLLDVLNAAGGPAFPPGRDNNKLRTYVLATGADGYQALLAWGEIDPDFGAEPVLVAWARDGQPLGDGQGMARLVVPGDKRGGRHVATLARLEVRDGGGASR
jgi:DMSO/TMAO reductase YedYZ molybdopterin-dependent catalytic subunit